MKEGLKSNTSLMAWCFWYIKYLFIFKFCVIKSCVKIHTNFKQDNKKFSAKNLPVGNNSLTKPVPILLVTGKATFPIKLAFPHKKDPKELPPTIIIAVAKQITKEMVKMIAELGLFSASEKNNKEKGKRVLWKKWENCSKKFYH